MTKVLNHHAPLQKKNIKLRDKCQGYNQEIKLAKEEQGRLERRWKRARLLTDRNKFLAQKLKLRKMREDADTKFYSDLALNNASYPCALFNVLKITLHKPNQSPLHFRNLLLKLRMKLLPFSQRKDKIQEQIWKLSELVHLQ